MACINVPAISSKHCTTPSSKLHAHHAATHRLPSRALDRSSCHKLYSSRSSRTGPVCMAEPNREPGSGSAPQKELEKLKVPDAPPGKGSSGDTAMGPAIVPKPSGAIEADSVLSDEEVQRIALLRAESREKVQKAEVEGNFVDGLLEEVRLIQWPNPLQAVSDTLVVIALVAGTSVALFAANTALAELSKLIYS